MSSVKVYCLQCETNRVADVVEVGVEPPADWYRRGRVARAVCPECGSDLFALDPDELVVYEFEVSPERHAMADELSAFSVQGTRAELDALEAEIAETQCVDAHQSSGAMSIAQVRAEYPWFFKDEEAGEEALIAADV